MVQLIRSILTELGEDPSRDGLTKTPERVDRSLRYLTSGYQKSADELLNGALFDVAYDESGQIVPLREFMAEPEDHASTDSGTVEFGKERELLV